MKKQPQQPRKAEAIRQIQSFIDAQVDIPPDFRRVVNERFWDLLEGDPDYSASALSERPDRASGDRGTLDRIRAGVDAFDDLPADVVKMCKRRGWSMHWTHRGAYLHLESSELIEAIRGKHGDPLKEAADVLLVLMSITESNGISWQNVLSQARTKCDDMMDRPRYPGEEYERATPVAVGHDASSEPRQNETNAVDSAPSSSGAPTEIEELVAAIDALERKATPGPWAVWDSNSFRRITHHADGDVISGVVQPSDGHPDLRAKRADLDVLCALRNAWPLLRVALQTAQKPNTPNDAVAKLRELLAKATQGPVSISLDASERGFTSVCSETRHWEVGRHEDYEDAELHVALRNNAEALLDAAERAVAVREALAELVRLEDLNDLIEFHNNESYNKPAGYADLCEEYQCKAPLAWSTARALLEETPK